MDKRITRIQNKQAEQEREIALLKSENAVLKKVFALLLAETGLTNQELNNLKPRAREIHQLLNEHILD